MSYLLNIKAVARLLRSVMPVMITNEQTTPQRDFGVHKSICVKYAREYGNTPKIATNGKNIYLHG